MSSSKALSNWLFYGPCPEKLYFMEKCSVFRKEKETDRYMDRLIEPYQLWTRHLAIIMFSVSTIDIATEIYSNI